MNISRFLWEVQATRDESWNASAVIGQTHRQRGPWQQCKRRRAHSRPSTKYSQTNPPPARTNFRSQKTPTLLFSVRRVSTFLGRNPQRCAVSNLSGGNVFPGRHAPRPIAFPNYKTHFSLELHCPSLSQSGAPALGFSSSLCAQTQERLGDARQVHCSRGGKQIVIAPAINKLFNCARCVHKSISAVRRNWIVGCGALTMLN